MKRQHKRILMSAVWQQSAHHPQADEYQQRDPTESLLWRSRIRRLKAEQIRDAMLAISGELQLQLGGPSVDAETPRRALYVKSFRNNQEPLLHAFDVANGLKSVAQRDTTTTPIQSLLLINGQYVLGRAQRLGERLGQRDAVPSEALSYVFRLTWGREPSSSELASALSFISGPTDGASRSDSIDPEKLTDLCHVLFNSSEFLYVD
jgi:hypothetical protein